MKKIQITSGGIFFDSHCRCMWSKQHTTVDLRDVIIAVRFTVQRLHYIRPNRCVWKLPTNWNRLWRLFKVNGNGTAGLFDNSRTIRVQFRVPRHCSPLAKFFFAAFSCRITRSKF